MSYSLDGIYKSQAQLANEIEEKRQRALARLSDSGAVALLAAPQKALLVTMFECPHCSSRFDGRYVKPGATIRCVCGRQIETPCDYQAVLERLNDFGMENLERLLRHLERQGR